MRRLPLIFAVVLAVHILGLTATTAQQWPTQSVTMVVPFAAGGPVDTIGRIIAARLSEVLGQQVIVEDVGGAGGMLGAARVAKAPPDGSQFLLAGSATHGQNQALYRRPLYNAITDFIPVTLLTDSPRILIARKDFPAANFAEFLAYAKTNARKMQYGTAGVGSGSHVCGLLLDGVIGTPITPVPYRGTGPAMQDLIGGRLDYTCEQISTVVPQISAGSVKGLVVLGPERVAVLPELPDMRELGYAGFDCGAWAGLAFPKGTPEPIVRRLAVAANEVAETPAVRERLQSLGVTIVAPERRTREYFANFIVSEIARWGAAIRASGVQVE
jgi:tripartite-type tricarboxylate transporter receptor subunit TctC